MAMTSFVLSALMFATALTRMPAQPTSIGFVITIDRASGSDVATWMTVRSIEPGGPADRGGIVPGDKITAVKGKPVHAKEELDVLLTLASLKAGQPVELAVVRGGKNRTVVVKPVPMTEEKIELFKNTIAMLERLRARRPQ